MTGPLHRTDPIIQWHLLNKYGVSPTLRGFRSENILLCSIWCWINFFLISLSFLRTWCPKYINENNLSGSDTRGYKIFYSNEFWEIIWSSCIILLMRIMSLKFKNLSKITATWRPKGRASNQCSSNWSMSHYHLTVPNHWNQWLLKVLLV